MTDNEIIKMLECCIGGYGLRNCDDCPVQGKAGCIEVLPRFALDLLSRQKAEIERLEKELTEYKLRLKMSECTVDEIKSETIKEFAKRLKCGVPQETGVIRCVDVDNLVKEMTEAAKWKK